MADCSHFTPSQQGGLRTNSYRWFTNRMHDALEAVHARFLAPNSVVAEASAIDLVGKVAVLFNPRCYSACGVNYFCCRGNFCCPCYDQFHYYSDCYCCHYYCYYYCYYYCHQHYRVPEAGDRVPGADGKVSRIASGVDVDGFQSQMVRCHALRRRGCSTESRGAWLGVTHSGVPEVDGKVSRLTSTRLLDGRRDTLPYVATAISTTIYRLPTTSCYELTSYYSCRCCYHCDHCYYSYPTMLLSL